MGHVFVKNERIIPASSDDIYSVLSDYKTKRPLLLTPNFLDYKVEQGGKGNGTVVSYRLRAANRERPYRMQVSETIKGKVLTERDSRSSLVTTWSLLPHENEEGTAVRVTTEWDGSSGVKGFFEKTFAPLGIRRIYDQILEMLELLVVPAEKRDLFGEVPSNESGWPKLLIFAAVISSAYGIYWFRKQRGIVSRKP